MDPTFTNSEKSKTSDLHKPLVNLTDKINLKRNDKYVILSNLSSYYIWKNIKKYTKPINLKNQLQRGMRNLNLNNGSCSVSDIQNYFEYVINNTNID